MPRPWIPMLTAALALPLCIVPLGPTTPASAQGLDSLPAIMKPEYFSRDLLLFIEGLSLTDEQQLISEMIFRDYEREFNAGIQGMEDQVTVVAESVHELGDDKDAIVKAVLKPIQDWSVQREILGQRLVENVRVILDEDQQRQWTAFYRRLQREKHLVDSVLSGEGTNLDHVLRDLNMQPDPNSQFAQAKLQWEIDLDRALMARFQVTADTGGLFSQIQSQVIDVQADLKKRRTLLAARVDVRDVNDQAIEQFTTMLGDKGPAFRNEAIKRGYGRVYRRTPAQRIFDAALEAPTVKEDPTLHQAVTDLYAQYMASLDALNVDILDTTRNWEPDREMSRIENRIRRLNGEAIERPQDPTRAMYQTRRDLGNEYVKLLQDLLGPEVFNELDGAARFIPRRPTDPSDSGAGGPGGSIRTSGGSAKYKEKPAGDLTGTVNHGRGGLGAAPPDKDD